MCDPELCWMHTSCSVNVSPNVIEVNLGEGLSSLWVRLGDTPLHQPPTWDTVEQVRNWRQIGKMEGQAAGILGEGLLGNVQGRGRSSRPSYFFFLRTS